MSLRNATKKELEYINVNFAKKELFEEDIYVLDSIVGNDYNLSEYFSRIGTSSLRNFVRDLKNVDDQIVLLINHGGGGFFGGDAGIPLGTWFKGKLSNVSEGHDFNATLYMSKDLEAKGYNTDQLVKAYEVGHLTDVSMSVTGGTPVCDICSNNIRSSDCSHFPGQKYEGVLCTFTIENAHLAGEISMAWKGALPGSKLNQDEKRKRGNVNFFYHNREGESHVVENIKDMPEDAVLCYTLTSKVGGMKLDANKSSDPGAQQLEKEVEKMTFEEIKEKYGDILSKNFVEKADHEKVVNENTDLTKQVKTAGKEKDTLTETLTKSEADKTDLQQTVNDQAGMVEVAEGHAESLKTEFKSLGASVFGDSWNEDAEMKELEGKSGVDLVSHLERKIGMFKNQQKDLKGSIPTGKQSLSKDDETGGGPSTAGDTTKDNIELGKRLARRFGPIRSDVVH